MRQTITMLDENSLAFPSTELALDEPNGLLAMGGDLSVNRLISAYKQGIFPWFNEFEPIVWWSPDPRAVIPVDDIRVNKTLKKFLKKCHYKVTLNQAFSDVIEKCADAPFRNEETWILDNMKAAYCRLHDDGKAHSIEVWEDDNLIGGLYGVAIEGYFSGESMFYARPNASKVALISLARYFKEHNIAFIDCQIMNPFLQSMGCIDITRSAFLAKQATALKTPLPKCFWQPKELPFL